MRTSSLSVLALVACALLADAASAKPRRPDQRRETPVARSLAFHAAGDFSGTIGETIVVNGVSYWVAPDAMIYQVGRGPLQRGAFVGYAHLHVSGEIRGRTQAVTQIMVRPGAARLGDPAAITEVPDTEKRPR